MTLVSASDATLAKRLMHMAHSSGSTSGVSKSSSDWLDYTGFPGDVPPGNKNAIVPNPLTKEESLFTTVTTRACQEQLKTRFS